MDKIGSNVDDPYTFGTGSGHRNFFPEIEYPDIYNFFVNTPSPHTREEMKAYKSCKSFKAELKDD